MGENPLGEKVFGKTKVHNYYDYDSIMHYGPFLEGTNTMVIKSKPLCNDKPCTIGQRKRLSLIDIKDIISCYADKLNFCL